MKIHFSWYIYAAILVLYLLVQYPINAASPSPDPGPRDSRYSSE